MSSYRKATHAEARLLTALIDAVPELNLDAAWAQNVEVEPLDDGGMGSLRLRLPAGVAREKKLRIAAELQFTDSDGVPVLVSLYVDRHGVPLEVDVWKVNYDPVIAIPDELPAAQRFSHDSGGNEK